MANLADYLPGWVDDWYYDPCMPTPTVFFKASFMALAKLGATLIEPDPKETFHKVTGNSWLKEFKVHAEEVEYLAAEGEYELLDSFFGVFEVYDMAIWYAFVASVTEDFLANWTSQIYKLSGCKGDPYHLTAESNVPLNGFNSSHNWGDGPSWGEIRGDAEILNLSSISVPPGGYGTLCGKIHGTNIATGLPVGIDTRIVNHDGVVFAGTQHPCDDVDKQGDSLTYIYNVWGGRNGQEVTLQARTNPNYNPLLLSFDKGKSFIKASVTYPHSGPPPERPNAINHPALLRVAERQRLGLL